MGIIINQINFPIYSLFILSSFIIGNIFAYIFLIRMAVPAYISIRVIIINVLMTAFGGTFFSSAMDGFKTIGGLSSIGGVFGILISVLIMIYIVPNYKKEILEANCMVIPIMYSISKIGCHFAGCCHGIYYEGLFNIKYNGTAEYLPDTSVFPVQLCESILFLIIYIVGVFIIYVKKTKHGVLYLACICSVAKFSLDYLRISHYGTKMLSVNQWLCVVIMFGAIAIDCIINIYRHRSIRSA